MAYEQVHYSSGRVLVAFRNLPKSAQVYWINDGGSLVKSVSKLIDAAAFNDFLEDFFNMEERAAGSVFVRNYDIEYGYILRCLGQNAPLEILAQRLLIDLYGKFVQIVGHQVAEIR